MTLMQIHDEIMFQTNNDSDDLGDYTPHIDDYINEGYNLIVEKWDGYHVPSEEYPKLESDEDEPNLPEWLHRYLADWATWLIYRNGNPQKQQRGLAFKSSFDQMLSRLADAGGKAGLNDDGSRKRYRNFFNIPR